MNGVIDNVADISSFSPLVLENIGITIKKVIEKPKRFDLIHCLYNYII